MHATEVINSTICNMHATEGCSPPEEKGGLVEVSPPSGEVHVVWGELSVEGIELSEIRTMILHQLVKS